MKKKLIVLSGFALALMLVLTPSLVLAQSTNQTGGGTFVCSGGTNVTDIPTMICKIGNILNSVVPVLVALGVVYFVWGVISYVIASDEEAKKSGRNRIIYGIIGLAVIVGVWGLVRIVVQTFVPQGNTGTIVLPTIGN